MERFKPKLYIRIDRNKIEEQIIPDLLNDNDSNRIDVEKMETEMRL